MEELNDESKKKLSRVPSVRFGSLGLILGQKAQQYDLRQSALVARKWTGHAVRASRTSETSIMASSNPTVNDFVRGRKPLWYVGKSRAAYDQHSLEYIKEAERWKTIKVENSRLIPEWKFEADILNASGDYLKTSYSYWIDASKGFQARGLIISDFVYSNLPTLKEMNESNLDMPTAQISSTMSLLDTFGMLKVVGTGAERRVIDLPLAYEIHGALVSRQLEENLTTPFGRLVFALIKKMPGLSFATLCRKLQVPLTETNSAMLRETISSLKQSNVIVATYDYERDDILLVPAWVCHILVDKYYPTVLDSERLKDVLRTCSSFWDRVGGTHVIDQEIELAKTHMRRILAAGGISLKEMFEIGPPVSGFLFELKRIGLLQQTEDDFFKIVPATRPIMDAMVTILSSAYTEELEDSKIDPAKISIALKEINASLQKMLEVISEKLSIQDYRKISGLD